MLKKWSDIFFVTPSWRKRWDSNPRAREGYLISSQARYDHFDTLPILLCAAMLSCNAYYFTGFSGKSQVFSVKKVDNDGHKRLKYTVYYLRAADGAARRRAFARFCFGK